MKKNLREARTDDYRNLFELFDAIDTLHRDNLPHRFKKASGPAREQDYFTELIDNENIGLFVAEMDGGLVGFVHGYIRDTPPIPILIPRRYAIVDSVVVKPGFQKRGIGRMLMDKIQKWAIDKDATSIELNVYEFNETAISFYERLGYQIVSRRMSKEL